MSKTLGNRLEVDSYRALRGLFQARLDAPMHDNGGAFREKVHRQPRMECVGGGIDDERLRPDQLPAAGTKKHRKTGKRLVGENTNTLSHTDTLIWGRDIDGSDGILKQGDTALYRGAAGLNPKAENTPIFGDLPPSCARTFGVPGEQSSTSYRRLDPRE